MNSSIAGGCLFTSPVHSATWHQCSFAVLFFGHLTFSYLDAEFSLTSLGPPLTLDSCFLVACVRLPLASNSGWEKHRWKSATERVTSLWTLSYISAVYFCQWHFLRAPGRFSNNRLCVGAFKGLITLLRALIKVLLRKFKKYSLLAKF